MLEKLLRSTQSSLKRLLHRELKRMGYIPKAQKGFLYAPGSVPVLLVAHLDTVHKCPIKTICASADGNILMSPQGIGGDDRAGVYMLLEIAKRHKCHLLFCEEEEVGGVGAYHFCDSGIRPMVNYIVECDRRGANDAVFYGCANLEFTEFVTGFGFRENLGSFSDISVIAPHLGVAAVNISSGYYNEHSLHEYIDLRVIRTNIERLCRMVVTPTESFEYIEDRSWWSGCSKALYFLEDGGYLRSPDGEMLDHFEDVLLDEDGHVYYYEPEYDAAAPLSGWSAYGPEGLPARPRLSDSIHMDILE